MSDNNGYKPWIHRQVLKRATDNRGTLDLLDLLDLLDKLEK